MKTGYIGRILGLAAGAGLLLGATAMRAEAAGPSVSVTSVTGTWSNVTGAPVTYSNGLSTITWGTATQGNKRSSYDFDGAAPPTQTAPLDTNVTLGTFTHNNYPITGASITGATLTLSIQGSISDGVNGVQTFTMTSSYKFTHDETPNNASPESNPANNDLVSVSTNVGGSTTISYAGKSYIFAFSAFEQNGVSTSTFSTVEGRANVANLQGRLTATPGPIAGTGLPIALAAAGFWLFRRRQSREA